MFFMPRVNGVIAMLAIAGIILLYVLELDLIAAIVGGIAFVFLLLGVLFDLYDGPKK